MFKDTKEGETHSYNDGCGEPAHNLKLPQHIEKRFDEEFDHIVPKILMEGKEALKEIKSFIATILDEEKDKMIKEVEDVRSQYEHEVYGLNSVDSFNNALDHVIQAINLIKEDK